MIKFSVFCLLFLALVAIASSEELKRIRLTKGTRNLDTQQNLKNVFMTSSDFFFVDTDFGPDINAQPSWDNTTIPYMAVMISSNETVFGGSCYHFDDYDCETPLCAPVENSSVPLQLPIIGVNTTRLSFNWTNTTTAVSIINGSWQLNAEPLMIVDCQFESISPSYPDGYSSYGWVGLGTEGNASSNFLTSGNPTFSTHLNATYSTGELIFGFDETRTSNSASPIVTLASDEQWRMNVTSISSGSNVNTPTTSLTVVFDLLYEGIAVPEDIYDSLKAQWTAIDGVTDCTDDDCEYNGRDLTPIPDLIFTLADGTKLTIPANHYWRSYYPSYEPTDDDSTNSWDLQMDPITTNNSGSNYTVLGWRVMSYFYSVFAKTATGNTITLYTPVPEYPGAVYTPTTPGTTTPGTPGTPDTTTPGTPDTTNPGTPTPTNPDTTVPDTSSGSYLYYYIGGIIGLVIIIAFVFFACRGSPKPSSPTKKRELNVELRASP